MRADVFIRQRYQRAIEVIRRIVDHQHFDAGIRRLRLMTGIELVAFSVNNPLFTRTPR